MDYKLKKDANGKVNALLRTGKDFVKDKIALSAAQHIIDSGKLVESDKEGYPIHVGEWYFEGEPVAAPQTAQPSDTKPQYINNHFGKRGKH